MLNKVELMGRLTETPELRMANGATPVVNFSLAVPRAKKNEDGTRAADFIACSAWRNTAEYLRKYAYKGQKIGIIGNRRLLHPTTKYVTFILHYLL